MNIHNLDFQYALVNTMKTKIKLRNYQLETNDKFILHISLNNCCLIFFHTHKNNNKLFTKTIILFIKYHFYFSKRS